MNGKTEGKEWVEALLVKYLDACLSEQGFRRRKGGSEYRRQSEEAEQRVLAYWHARPAYAPGALAHLYPKIRISLSAVNRLALALAGDPSLIGDMGDVTLEQPVDLAAPKGAQERWLLCREPDVDAVGLRVESFFRTWVVSLLNQYTSARALIDGYEGKDDRILNQQHWPIFIAAAHLTTGNVDGATRVLEERFSSVGLRRRFQHAFDFVARWPSGV